MAALPAFNNEAAMRALDAKCVSPTSNDSTRTVAQLGKLPLATRKSYLLNAVIDDLPHLVRCVLHEVSADTRFGEGEIPAVCVAAERGSSRALKVLLEGGANLVLVGRGTSGYPAIYRAASYGHLSCLRILLDAGADPHGVSPVQRSTPLQSAIMYHHVECVRALLPVSNLLHRSNDGENALHVCVHTASEECFELLLPLMEDVDVRTAPGVDEHNRPLRVHSQTALHVAVAGGQMTMARALLKRGADRMAIDSEQYSPLHWAAQMGALSCVILLVGRPEKPSLTPADVNLSARGWTALHLAAARGHEKICGVLLSVGARLDVKMADGVTPLMVAQRHQPTNAALIELLSGLGPANPPGTVCDHCGKPAASVRKMLACAVCHLVRYCSSACQVSAWEGHKADCEAGKATREALTSLRSNSDGEGGAAMSSA